MSTSTSSPSLKRQTMYTPPASAQPSPSSRRRYVCNQCERSFTTSGHLARHTRVHTGERNHKCPFPGCETRCSRQDNLQQHYRIHLSPGSRRTSGTATRAAMSRQARLSQTPSSAGTTHGRSRSRSSSCTPPLALASAVDGHPAAQPASVPEPPDTPPPLEHAYTSQSVSSSARSTPELVQAPQYALGGAGAGGALHPASKAAPSPELAYAPQAHWQDGARYGAVKADTSFYDEREQPPSPASSSGSQYGAHSQPVSPTTPYYGQYSAHHQHHHHGASPSALGKYAPSPTRTRVSSLSHTTTSQMSTSPGHATGSYASGYSHTYPGGSGSSGGSSYSSGGGVSVGVYAAGALDGASDAHCSYPPPYAPYSAQGYAAPHASTSHARAASPPVHLAPIQTDRLVRGGGGGGGASVPSLPALSSATSMAPQHYAVPDAPAPPPPPPPQQQQQQQHAPAHDGQMQYPYSSYSALSATNGAHGSSTWRPEHQLYRRSSLAV